MVVDERPKLVAADIVSKETMLFGAILFRSKVNNLVSVLPVELRLAVAKLSSPRNSEI